jgi:type II secretory pathway predicted ATPase ExeA
VSQEYLEYWGLNRSPYQLAPDEDMMYLGGQYYECFERLLYAVNTNKGGVLLVSEEAGLGKTTLLLKLISELSEEHGELYRYSFLDHPTLTTAQVVSHIAAGITGTRPDDDKFKNLMAMKETLIDLKKSGGKATVIVDEAHMLCDRKEVLQELRMLLNLTYDRQYLITVILSGQKPLWDTVKTIPEFWQRLPVKYYLIPLGVDEAAALITSRLDKAGLEGDQEVFTQEAIQIIHRFAHGLPRTMVALADVALLIGYSYHARKIGFKEVSKAIHAISGKDDRGSSLPYAADPNIVSEPEPSFFKGFLKRIRV